MTSIHLDDKTAAGLAAIATLQQMTVEEYLQSLVSREMPTVDTPPVVEFEGELTPLLFSGPSLPADFSRADIYADHD